MTNIHAIILARGNSKEIKNKNLTKVNSKPLIYWSIKAALESNVFDKVVVSTDDEEIAAISKSFGAEVPFLRLKTADDFSSSSDATFEALFQAEEFWQNQFINVCQMMANCPLKSSEDIKNSFNAYKNSNADAQISCFKYGWMNPWWAFKLDKQMKAERLFPEAIKQRSQDLPQLYCPTGALWFIKRHIFLKTKNFYTLNTRFEPLAWSSSVDIDDQNDFEMAEVISQMQHKKNY
mgnify:CR=1 FL=1